MRARIMNRRYIFVVSIKTDMRETEKATLIFIK